MVDQGFIPRFSWRELFPQSHRLFFFLLGSPSPLQQGTASCGSCCSWLWLGPHRPCRPGSWQVRLRPPSCPGPASRCLELGLLVLPLMCACAWTSLSVGCGVLGQLGDSCSQLFAASQGCCLPREGETDFKGDPGRQGPGSHPWPDLAAPRAWGQEVAGLVLSERPVLALSIRWGSLRKLGKSQWLGALGEAASWRWLQPSLTGHLPNSCLRPEWTEPGQRSSWPFPGALACRGLRPQLWPGNGDLCPAWCSLSDSEKLHFCSWGYSLQRENGLFNIATNKPYSVLLAPELPTTLQLGSLSLSTSE